MADKELYGLLTLRSEIGFYSWFARVFLRKRQKRERYSFFRNNQKFSRSAKILIRYRVLWVAINDIMQVTQPTGGVQCGLSLIWWDWRQADLENVENTDCVPCAEAHGRKFHSRELRNFHLSIFMKVKHSMPWYNLCTSWQFENEN